MTALPAFRLPPSLWRAVATTAGIDWPLTPASVPRYVDAVASQRLLPIAAAAEVPVVARDLVAARYGAVAEEVEARDREVEAILEAASRGLTVNWVAMYGADYRTRLYPRSSMRGMKDVDVLVPARSLARLVEELRPVGFQPRPRRPGVTEVILDVAGMTTWLDIYDGSFGTSRTTLDPEELWRSHVRGDDGLPRLALHHATAVHALLLSMFLYATHLRKFLDLWLLAQDDEAVRRALECAERWRTRRATYSSFRVLGNLFPEMAEAPWYPEVESLVTDSERRSLRHHVVDRAPYAHLPARATQIRRKLVLIDTTRDRFRLGWAYADTTVARLLARTGRGQEGL